MYENDKKHRGAHPEDHGIFDDIKLELLRKAVRDLSWLLSREYVMHSAIELVGNHYNLTQRQRMAVSRAACSDQSRKIRIEKCLLLNEIKNRQIVIDGFNLIITVETALSGGVIFQCRDQCIRDIAGVHGSYRLVHETGQAIKLIGESLAVFKPESTLWLFDKPVSNSGRLACAVRDIGNEYGWHWEADVNEDPDQTILSTDLIAITSDSLILDKAGRWANLGSWLIHTKIPGAWIIDLTENISNTCKYSGA